MLQPPRGLRAEFRAMLRLALPIVAVQLGQMLMGVVDTLMVGRLSAEALAAVALGNLYFFGVAIFGFGILLALDPVVAQAVGAGDADGAARGVQRGFLLATVLGLIVMVLLLPARSILTVLGQPAAVVELASVYVRISIVGTIPFYYFTVLRQSLQAHQRVSHILVTTAVANLLNVALNYAWIFGKLGFPALGVAGAAWATAASRAFMAAFLVLTAWKIVKPLLAPPRSDIWSLQPMRRMLAIGVPIGCQLQLEYGVFGVVGLLMGRFGAHELAGHQVALNLASLTFMVPLGVSAAAAVLVGHAIGRGDAAEARRAAGAALVCGPGAMALSALTMLAIPDALARIYTTDAQVAALAASLIPIAGVFQVFDGTQVVAIGILRGVADTRAPMIVNVLGYWLVGLPISAALGLWLDAGPQGLWWGLTAGLMLVAVALVWRVRRRLARSLARVAVDR
jgi:MATE family multidrug resistance protein